MIFTLTEITFWQEALSLFNLIISAICGKWFRNLLEVFKDFLLLSSDLITTHWPKNLGVALSILKLAIVKVHKVENLRLQSEYL